MSIWHEILAGNLQRSSSGRTKPHPIATRESGLAQAGITATYEITDVGIVNVEPDLSQVASDRVDLSTQ
jgi:hypothetical protein